MSSLEEWSRMMRVVWTDPKLVAQVEWHREYGLAAQMERQWSRGAMAGFVATGQHADPDVHLKLIPYEMPDFDWWEPRYDQPGRREQARRREAGIA